MFKDKKVVTVGIAGVKLGIVEVVRDGEYKPILINPTIKNENLVYEFLKPETGRIF